MTHVPSAKRLTLALLMLLSACGGGGGSTDDGGAALTIVAASVPATGSSGAAYSATLRADGGSGTGYVWALVIGALPDGVVGLPAFGSTAALNGVLGTPGSYTFTVELRDSTGASTAATFTVIVTTGGGGGGGTNRATSLTNAPVGRSAHTPSGPAPR